MASLASGVGLTRGQDEGLRGTIEPCAIPDSPDTSERLSLRERLYFNHNHCEHLQKHISWEQPDCRG